MSENELDIKKAFEAIARIISAREHAEITVKSIQKKDNRKETPP